jgi:hypothetical protein
MITLLYTFDRYVCFNYFVQFVIQSYEALQDNVNPQLLQTNTTLPCGGRFGELMGCGVDGEIQGE